MSTPPASTAHTRAHRAGFLLLGALCAIGVLTLVVTLLLAALHSSGVISGFGGVGGPGIAGGSGGSSASDGGSDGVSGGESDGGAGSSTDGSSVAAAALEPLDLANAGACPVGPTPSTQDKLEGHLRGGVLDAQIPVGWESLPEGWEEQIALTDHAGAWPTTGDGWRPSLVLGRVHSELLTARKVYDTPKSRNLKPADLQETARAMMTCLLTAPHSQRLYGTSPQTDYLSGSALTVDGHRAYRLTTHVRMHATAGAGPARTVLLIVVVVDTPDGPDALAGGVPAGDVGQRIALEKMVRGLTVTTDEQHV